MAGRFIVGQILVCQDSNLRRQAGMPVVLCRDSNLQDRQECLSSLEVEFKPKLKLSWIKRSGGAAVITAITRSLFEGVDVVDKWRRRRFVETIEEVEALGNEIQSNAFTQSHSATDPHVQRGETVGYAGVTAQAS